MSYEHLTLGERYVIYHLKLCNFSLREIGRRLGRHHSTISRELERNRPAISGMPGRIKGARLELALPHHVLPNLRTFEKP